jgi:hypothetical protein
MRESIRPSIFSLITRPFSNRTSHIENLQNLRNFNIRINFLALTTMLRCYYRSSFSFTYSLFWDFWRNSNVFSSIYSTMIREFDC